MLFFGEREKLVPIPEIPSSNSSYQTPTYLRVGDDLYLSYFIEPILKNRWSEHNARDTIKYIESAPHVVLHFSHTIYFSSKKQEGIITSKDQISKNGRDTFQIFEVLHSNLIASLLADQDKGDLHQPPLQHTLRHFIFPMHGHTLEIASSACIPHLRTGPLLSDLEGILRTAVFSPSAKELAEA